MNVVHRLGVAVCIAVTVLWLVHLLSARRRERTVRRRLSALLGTVRRAAPAREARVRHAVRRWAPVVGAACAGYALVGGVVGCLVGAVAGYGALRWRRTGAPAPDVDADAAARQLPLAADLLAACIAAGADPVRAAQAVGGSLGGPVGERLAWGAAEVRLGGEPAEAWRRLAAIPGAEALARLLERAGESGAPAAVPVARLATEARAEWGRTATAKARRAGVLITAPVGLCFLPAFIAVGVVPVLIGLAGGVLGGGGG
ncbi:type II secretion system F family protein [Streptomyces sp. PSKA54]|uniref:Type II secretion system F family protein n=1 Tax=Streptomyces himalayensis subsp. aureolus TaxID=2758039 RepID=A0A7W2HJX2_9ACTN|nr:type II secretion system F family protein [Streptomyces himalayensis]MBA4866566.1 type II secretion system F family protein [Streptomyces himalayensis subsp. aureolus]